LFWWIPGEGEWGEFPKVIPGESISLTAQMKFIGVVISAKIQQDNS
jgi:hypothetical protein